MFKDLKPVRKKRGERMSVFKITKSSTMALLADADNLCTLRHNFVSYKDLLASSETRIISMQMMLLKLIFGTQYISGIN